MIFEMQTHTLPGMKRRRQMKLQITASGSYQTVLCKLRPSYYLAALLMLGLCSCSSSRNQITGDPFAEASPQTINAHEESASGAGIPIESAVHVEMAQPHNRRR